MGEDIHVPQTYKVEDYLREQQEAGIQSGIRNAAQTYTSTGGTSSTGDAGSTPGQDQGKGILSDYGTVSIPIPPSIVPTIFGKPSINLQVNGDVAIHLAYRDNQFLQTTGSLLSGSETGLDFRQEVNMNIKGSVGDKVKINTDFGSLRQFNFDNIFNLSYKGYPDEIIQSIDAGNISLTTPSKYIGIQSGLFGFKGVMRFGPWYVTALAAQKKAEKQTKTFGGGPGSSGGSDFVIQPANFRKNMYFLDTVFVPRFEQAYATIPRQAISEVIVNGSVEVWRSTNQTDIRKMSAYCQYNLPGILPGGSYKPIDNYKQNTDHDLFESGYVIKVDTSQFSVDYVTGVITLYQEPSDYDFIGVSYQTTPAAGQALQYGDRIGNGQDTAIVLKLLKPKSLFTTTSKSSWKNLLKNSYYVGATNIDQKGFSVKVQYTFPSGQVYEYVRAAAGLDKAITVTGLDRYENSSSAPRPDGLFDVISNGATSPLLNSRTGTLIFPYLEPFGKRMLDYFAEQKRKKASYRPDSTFYFPEVYTQSPAFWQSSSGYSTPKNNEMSINVRYSGGTSTVINLNAFNIVEGSVRVTAGGRQLTEGVDYRVDINSGTVTLLKPDLATAGQISVDYDTHDIFTTSTKTLVGLRAELPLGDRGLFGTTLMNYSMHLPTIKTRQGEEPLSNWILGGDLSYKVPTPFLTDWMNALPIFNLHDKSDINFKIDAALSMPNPNTQESPMGVDNGSSIAYLDDFEGGRTETPLSMSYGRWVHSSQPQFPAGSVLSSLSPDEINSRKSRMWWFQAQPQDVKITDIKPNKSVASAAEYAQVLDMIFDPTQINGIYNHNPVPLSVEPPENRWDGMMQYQQGLNVLATNTDAVEFWMKIQNDGNSNGNGILHFDMGRMSEDVIPDGHLETEDKNGNGRYDPDEDVGLDTLTNDVEKATYPSPANANDPNNDNYSYTSNSQRYDDINGTEGNQNDPSSGYKPDTEDLDNDLSVNQDNSYYEYDIPLSPNSPFIIGKNDQWFQFRIPLTSFSRMVGNIDSSFSDISYYRMWLSGFKERVQLRFYDIGLFGSQWTRGREGLNPNNPVGDTTFSINYVNIEDNAAAPTNYTSPPGAERDKLAGQAAVVLGNEQSIALRLNCVPNYATDSTHDKREAIRVFPSPNDLFNYRSMAIWVHGDDNMPDKIEATDNKVWVYFRFGSSKYHYYEYKRPLTKGWNNIHVDFATLAALKATKKNYSDIATAPANDGYLGSTYSVVGSPNITNAPVFTLGVENKTDQNCLQTEVWFDELRLLDANDHTDFALNGNMQVKLAEFGTITTNFLYERPEFHRVDERFNTTRALTTGFSLTGEFLMQKILPAWLERGTKFPLTLSHSESLLSPKYLPNTDVERDGAIAKINDQASQGIISSDEARRRTDSLNLVTETLTIRNSIGMSGVQFNFPGSFFLLPAFVNRLVYGFGFGEEFTRSPIYDYYRNWSWTASVLYDLPQLPNASVSPLTWVSPSTFDIGRYSNWKINFLPQKISMNASFTRSRLHYMNRVSTLQFTETMSPEDSELVRRSLVPFVTRSDTATRSLSFNWKLTENGLLSPALDYSLYVVSNITPLETTPINNQPDNTYDSVYYYQRPFKSVLGDVFFKDGALVRPGKDFYSTQHLRITTNPRLPWILWIDKYIRPIFSYTVDYRWFDAQAGVQNDRTGQWNNLISTGIELNLKELGADIFGPDAAPAKQQRGPQRVGALPVDRVDNPAISQPPPGNGTGIEMGAPNPRLQRVGDVPKQLPSQIVRDTVKPSQAVVNTYGDTLLHIPGVGTEGERGDFEASDTLLLPKAPPAQVVEVPEEPPTNLARDIAKALIQEPFFDWTGTKFNFTQTNYSLNGALQGGGPGITNFLARGIFSPEDDVFGPSRAYQMGLITDPHGRLLIKFKPQFPFVEFGVRHGLRQASPVPGQTIDITDVFRQKNTFELQTTKPLWAGASISLNWKTEFTFDERDNLRIGPDGSVTPLQVEKIGDVSRTFFSIPPIFNLSKSGIEAVGRKWIEKTAAVGALTDIQRDALDPQTKNKLQVQSFMEGFETLPLFTGALREFIPRLNYSFNWSGLEKFPVFSFADRASFRHTYVGNYKRTFKLNPTDTFQLSTLQLVTYAFRPLAALDMNWDKIWGGRLTFSVNYDTQTDWASDYSFNRITSRLSTTFGVSANFQKQGLSIPFFKLNLKNNFGATFNFSQTISSDLYYTFNSILTDPDGTSNGGITKITVEPRFSYDINQQLTIEGFYRYERTTPAEGVILAPPTRTITAGFDIRLKVF